MVDQKHEVLLRKLVANARAMITDQVGLSVGASKMWKILYWLTPDECPDISSIDVFDKYNEQTRLIPTGSARLHCSREAFQRYDQALEDVNKRFRSRILDVCFEIVEKYGNKNN